MDYQCSIEEMKAQKALSIRTRTSVEKLPQVFGGIYGSVIQYMQEKGLQPAGVPFALYYNEDMQDLDLEAGFPVASDVEGKGNIKTTEIAGGKYATCTHIGPYKDTCPAYEALWKWIQENGHAPVGICYEFYINDPANTPEEKLETKILFPLK